MSGRNGSASDADCRISEDCRVPDVELMELGPLLEEEGGRKAAAKSVHPEVGWSQEITLKQKQNARGSKHFLTFFRELRCSVMRKRMMTRWVRF